MAQTRLDVIEKHVVKYTLNENGKLTKEQVEQYDRDGFLLVRGLLSQEDVTKLCKRYSDIANGAEHKVGSIVRDVTLKKQKNLRMTSENITKLQDWVHDEGLFDFCRHPGVVEYAEAIIGSDLRAMHTMFINKPPDRGSGSSRHPPHQDLWYFPWRPAEHTVAAWAALEKIDEENGCLFVVPGSHKTDLLAHTYPDDGIVNKAYLGIKGLSSEVFASRLPLVPMEAGDVLFFHPLIVHGSGRNNSQRFRKAISCHYVNPAISAWRLDLLQRPGHLETAQMVKMKSGVVIPWVDVWKVWYFKSRMVKGREGNMTLSNPPHVPEE